MTAPISERWRHHRRTEHGGRVGLLLLAEQQEHSRDVAVFGGEVERSVVVAVSLAQGVLDPLLAHALKQVGQTLQIVVFRRQVDEALALPVLCIQNLLLPTLANVYTRARVR